MRLNHADAKSNREPESPCDGAEKPDRACPVASYREGGSDSLDDEPNCGQQVPASSPYCGFAAYSRCGVLALKRPRYCQRNVSLINHARLRRYSKVPFSCKPSVINRGSKWIAESIAAFGIIGGQLASTLRRRPPSNSPSTG